MKNLIGEVHRRSLWQVLGIYLAGSWVALQVVEQLTEAAGLPDWVRPFSLVLLVVGFPIVMATAFVQEGMTTKEPPPAPQSLADVGEIEPPSIPDRGGRHRIFTWRNALLGGGAAFVLLGILTAGYLFMRTSGIGPAGTLVAKGVLDERDRIVLADFGGATSNATLPSTVTEALRVDLARSQVVRLADPAMVSSALQRMGRADAETLDESLARELAQREGLKAVLTGEVAPAGSGYVLTASLIAPATGEILTSERVSASGDDEVIGAIDELSKQLRERIGESLRTIQAEEPLEQVTTSDLEALRLYTEGAQLVEGNEYRRGIDLLEEAINRDTTFAMAYRKLGIELFNRFENRARASEALTKAYEYRDRLTTRERYLAEAAYFDNVSPDDERVIGAYQNMLDLDPEDPWALNNLGGLYGNRRDYAEAEVYFQRAIEADSLSGLFPFTNAVFVQANQGRFEEAEATLERARRLFPGEWLVDQRWFLLPIAQLDYEGAEARLAEVRERWTTPFLRDQGTSFAAGVATVRGRLAEAERAMQEAERINVERGLRGEALGRALGMAWVDVLLREDPDAALARVDRALDRHPLDEIPAADRPYVQLARLTALSGDVDGSLAWKDQFETELPEDARGLGDRFMGLAEADRQLVTGAPDRAIELYSQMADICPRCGLALIGRAHLEANRPDSTIAVFTRLVETPDLFRVNADGEELGPTYEHLARLHHERGDLDEAAKYYAALVELWAEADQELQPRVRAAQVRLEEILRETG